MEANSGARNLNVVNILHGTSVEVFDSRMAVLKAGNYPTLFQRLRLIQQLSTRSEQEFMLLLSTPIRGLDGKEIREIAVPKDTSILVGI